MKIPPVEPEFLNAEGQTDTHEDPIVAFRNFSNSPQKN